MKLEQLRSWPAKVTLEFVDLDSTTTKEDDEEALKKELKEEYGDAKVSISKPTRRGQVKTFAKLDEQVANKLPETPRIKIGWINSRARPRTQVPRCFKCLGYGHQAWNCKGPDRINLCYKCSKGALCAETLWCVICAELPKKSESLNYVPGSDACKVFRQILAKLKEIRK